MTLLQLLDEKNLFREMRFCWLVPLRRFDIRQSRIYSRIDTERNTILSEQTSLFRINCVDCLDRTNVVQAAIAKTYLEMMVRQFFFQISSSQLLFHFFVVEKSWFIRFG